MIYVSFFFKGRNAIVNLVVVSALGGIALALALPGGGAAETWVLVVGALAQAAGTTIALRRHLLRAFERSRATGPCSTRSFSTRPAASPSSTATCRYVRVNPMLADLLGAPSDAIVGRSVRELTPGTPTASRPCCGT